MFKIDWLRHPAIGVGSFTAIGLILVVLANEGVMPSAGGDQRSHDKLTYFENRDLAVEAPPRNPYPDRDEWREEQDLQAQQWMMRWAAAMFFITTAGVWYVAQTLRATRDAAKAAQDTVEVTRDIANKQLRAYIHITAIRIRNNTAFQRELASAMSSEGKNFRFYDLEFQIENTGNTPARDVALAFRMDNRRHAAERTIAKRPAGPYRSFYLGARADYSLTQGILLTVGDSGKLYAEVGKSTEAPSINTPVFLDGTICYTDFLGVRRAFWWSYYITREFLSNGYREVNFKFRGDDTSLLSYNKIEPEYEIGPDQNR